MRNRKVGSRRERPVPPRTLRALDELVCAVAALHGARGPTLLSGLSEMLRPIAMGLVERTTQRNRAERHALLASTFAARFTAPATSQDLFGNLGSEVRKVLPRRNAAAAPRAGKLERWARRILLEEHFHTPPRS